MSKNRIGKLIAAGVISTACMGWLLKASADAEHLSLLNLAKDPLIAHTLYDKPERMVSKIAASGAVGENAKWESGEASKYYIELQRYGADLIQAGVVRRDDELIQQGWKLLAWGFGKQDRSGGFEGTGDPFHSTSFFVEGSARAMLMEKQSEDPNLVAQIEPYVPKLRKAAHWLMNPEVITRYRYHNQPYTHRRWLLAAALGEAGAVINDSALEEAARDYAQDGIRLQTSEGINPEKGGGDVNYQALGIMLAERYYTVCRDEELRHQVAGMIQHGLDWELTKIDANGDVNAEGSTRTGKEEGRAGNTKGIEYKIIVQAMEQGYRITGLPRFKDAAERIAKSRNWIAS